MTLLTTQPNTATVRAACYRRVSSEEQAGPDKASLDQQRAMAEQEAKRQGWYLTGDYVDPGISGERFEERPGLQQLLKDARARKFDVLIVQNGDRIARRIDIYTAVVQIVENECRIPILDLASPLPVDPLDFEPGQDEIRLFSHGLRSMIASADQRQRKRRLKAGQEAKAKSGHFLPSLPPYGYREVWKPVPGEKPVRTFEIVPEQYEVLRRMARWVLEEGLTVRQISNRLRQLDAPTAHGGRWVDTTVLNYLANPFYAGKTAYKRRKLVLNPANRGGYGTIKNPKPETIILADHPLEIPWTWEEWEAIQGVIIKKRAVAPRTKVSPNPLAGIVRCAHCRLLLGYGINHIKLKDGGKNLKPYFRCNTNSRNKLDCRPLYLMADETLKLIWLYLDEAEKKVRENPQQFKLDVDQSRERQELQRIEIAENAARNDFARIARQRTTLDERLLDGLELSRYEALATKLEQEEESARWALLECENARREIALRQAQAGELRDFFSEWSEFRNYLDTPLLEWEPEKLDKVKYAFDKAIKGIYVKKLKHYRHKWKLDIEIEWRGQD